MAKARRPLPFGGQIITVILVLLILVSVYSVMATPTEAPDNLTLSELARAVSAGQVTEIEIAGDALAVRTANQSGARMVLFISPRCLLC